MASGYTIYEMSSFPHKEPGEKIIVPRQLPLIEGVESPRTEFELQRHLDNQRIEVFHVLHEVLEERVGRAKGVEFTEFVAPYHFPAYFHRPSKVLMLKKGKNIARTAMKSLIDNVSGIEGEYKRVDLSSITAQIERFKGAWIHVYDSADVTSQAFFGPSVDRDPRFEQASSEGDIFYIRIDYPFADRFFHVGISEDYVVVVFDHNLDELFELQLILDVKERLLDRAVPK